MPVSGTPLKVTVSLPRAAASEPVPVDRGQVWTVVGVGATSARSTRSRPLPENFSAFGVMALPSAVFMINAFTWSGVRFGRALSNSAAAPDTTAAACDEPLPLNRYGFT